MAPPQTIISVPVQTAVCLRRTNGAPAVRYSHTAVWTGTEMIVWGGYSNAYLNGGGRYNPATNTWAAGGTSTSGAPGGRSTHTAVWTGTEMIVWGGLAPSASP